MQSINIILVLICFSGTLAAAQSLPVYRVLSKFEGVNEMQERYNDLYAYTRILEDPTGEWTFRDILTKSDAFGENTTRIDKDRRKVYWVQLQLQSSVKDSFLFSVGKLYDDHNLVDLYYEQADSLVHQTSGYTLRPAEKAIRRSGSYFWVHLPANAIQTVYFRVDNVHKDCFCYDKNPVSVFHIDRQVAQFGQDAYVLWDLDAEPLPGNGPRKVELVRYFEFYADAECNLNLEDVQKDWDQQSYFRGYKTRDMPLDTCHWVRLRVVNPKPERQSRTLAYDHNRWKRIEYYLPDDKGQYRPYEAFPDANDQEAFSFSINPFDTLDLYIRYPTRDNSFALTGVMTDVHPDDLRERQGRAEYKYLFVGMIAFLLLYFSLQLIGNWDELLLYYLLTLIGLTPFFLISLDHTAFFTYTRSVYNMPEVLNEYLILAARLLALIGLLKFTQLALNLKSHLPRFNTVINWAIVIGIAISLASAVLYTFNWRDIFSSPFCLYCLSFRLAWQFSGVALGFLLFTSVWAFFKKVPLSGKFMIALLPVGLSIFWNSFLRIFLFPEFEIYAPFIIGLFLTLLLFGLFVGARAKRMQGEKLESEKQKILLENQLLQIESKALRAQMNPHFIFNCLNSIKSLIQEMENKKAIHYLTLFSKFIRKVLYHSEEKQITLEEEVEMSRLYMEMEKLRFEKSFNFRIEIGPEVDTGFFKVPPMILQPFLENAIWHGLMHKDGERIVTLQISSVGEGIKCVVEDNGIGRERAAALRVNTQSEHRSFGTRLIQDRLKVNKALFHNNFVINIIDKVVNNTPTGTRVELSLST